VGGVDYSLTLKPILLSAVLEFINKKKQAIDALFELVEEFKNGEKESLIQGVTVISKTEMRIDIDWIRGIDDEEQNVSN